MNLLKRLWDPFAEEEDDSGSGGERTPPPKDAESWCREAEAAEEAGEWSRAVVCYRRALRLAPFNRTIMACFAEAVEEQIRTVEHSAGRVRRLPLRSGTSSVQETPDPEELPAKTPRLPARRPSARGRAPGAAASLLRPLAFTGALGAVALLVVGMGALGVSAATGFVKGLFGEPDVTAAVVRQLPQEITSVVVEANELVVAGETSAAAEMLREARVRFSAHRDVLDPALAQVLRAAGAAESRAHHFASAADAYREAAQLHPDSPLNWIDLGRALRERARATSNSSEREPLLREAREAYERALEISPGHAQALLGLAQVHDAAGQRGLAVETYLQLAEKSPNTLEGQLAQTALQQLRGR